MSDTNGFITPPALQPGMTIGVFAPSSPLRNTKIAEGLDYLWRRGFKIVTGQHLYDRHGYLAGTDASRAADLNRLLNDPKIDAILCARGGYGACRLLDHIDWNAAHTPKIFAGYSDVTTLHLAFERRRGWITFHAPMVSAFGTGLAKTAEDSFWQIVGQASPGGCYQTDEANVQTLCGGKVEGQLAGGCIALLAAAVGTPEQPDFTGRLVLLEDVGEVPYRVDRMLTQLLRAGLLQRAAGFIIGTVSAWDDAPEDYQPTLRAMPLDTIWRDHILPLGVPTIVGFPFGHEPNPLTMPLGCRAELDADTATLTLLEPAVR